MNCLEKFGAAMAVLFFVALGSSACNPNSIGRACVNPAQSAPSGTQISSPALECPSRLCLIQQVSSTTTTSTSDASTNTQCNGGRCTCTAECGSDDDCDAETKDQCQRGFVCAVATQVGSFCCKKLCVCKDDLVPGFNQAAMPDANGNQPVITPYACDPTQPGSIVTCENVKQ